MHLKLDTGMTRIGFFAYDNERTLDELRQVAQLPHLHIEGVFMHFCVADSRAEADVSFTKLQYKRFMDMLSAMAGAGIRPEIRHCCNSGATILYPEFALDMVRPGIITYGNAPSDELEGALSLRPMMSLHSMIAQVRTVPAGTDISYGRLYRTKEETRVAVLPIGYADGLSRLLTGKARLPTHIALTGHDVGLSKDSVILLEQIRTIDKRRLREHTGHADRSVMDQVDSALAVSFGLQGS